ncbi:hypothetical protein V5P93_006267 [Actinokineospora auranticolor]|nr:hypothetical protein [Actinokineospora auranticolor]
MKTSDPRPRRVTRLLAAVGLVLATGSFSLAAQLPAAAQADSGVTKEVTFENGDKGRVTVNKTENMRRETVRVEWSGFLPTNNVSGLPFNALQPNSERMPVAVMQCRGKNPTREQCVWYEYGADRYALEFDPAEAATDGVYETGYVPFVDTKGETHYLDDCPPVGGECGDGITDHPGDWFTFGRQARLAFTGADGKGAIDFEVRTGDEMPNSLGCGRVIVPGTAPIECSLVVVPVRPMPCTSPDVPAGCPDSISDDYTLLNSYVMAMSGSNWKNRFVFPLDFLPQEGYCPLDANARLPMAGSEIAAEAVYRWIPALCTGAAAIPSSYTPVGEGEARRQYHQGLQSFVVGSRPVRPEDTDRATAHAPLSIGGFVFAYMIDRPDNQQQVTHLRLNARLVAKLITQSYRGRWGGEPDLSGVDPTTRFLPNQPETLFGDQEFLSLNPDLTGLILDSTMSTPLLVTGDGDLPHAVTSWLLADPDAAAFLKGTPDQWGTKVNPAFLDWPTPADQFDYRDTFVGNRDARPAKDGQCTVTNPTTGAEERYTCARHAAQLHELLAQRSSKLRDIGTNLLNGQTLQSTEWDLNAGVWKRPAPQRLGGRSLIGITDYATALRYRVPVAELANGKDATGRPVFVTPNDQSMLAAVRSGVLDQTTGTIGLDYTKLGAAAYPGTTIDYAAVATTGLTAPTADRYAKILEFAASPQAQTTGPNLGALPLGYLPLPEELRVQTRTVATAVREQKAAVPPPPFTDPKTIGTSGGASARGSVGNTVNAAGGNNNSAPAAGPAAQAAAPAGAAPANAEQATAKRAVVNTQADRSGFLKWGLPIALALGLLAAVAVPLGWLGSQPGTPVNRFFLGLRDAVRRR